MFVNQIKICPDLRKIQIRFYRLRQCLFLKLLRQCRDRGDGLLKSQLEIFKLLLKDTDSVCFYDILLKSGSCLNRKRT
jgi:hypothetical protein